MRKSFVLFFLLFQTFSVFSGEYSFKLESGATFSIKTPEGKTLTDCIHNPELIPEYFLHTYTPEQQEHYSTGSPIIIALSELFEQFPDLNGEPTNTFSATGFSLTTICTENLDYSAGEVLASYPCLFRSCDVTAFTNLRTRNTHHRKDHKTEYERLKKEKNIKCSICNRNFSSLLAILQHHGNVHFGLKQFD